MSASAEKLTGTVLMCDPEGASSLPDDESFQVLIRPRRNVAERIHNVFVLATATCLHEVAHFVTVANRRHQLRVLFVRSDIDATWLPHMFDLANLRTTRNTLPHRDFAVPHRVLRAWTAGAQHELIADAQVAGDSLFVVSCEPERYEIPFETMPSLQGIPQAERHKFTIASDGSYIHWPAVDLHLDLDALLSAINPEHKKRGEAFKRAYGERYGSAIAKLRADKGLRQTDVAGLSEREVRRIETVGEATIDSLRKLAAAHSMALESYLDTLARLVGPSEAETHASGPSRKHPLKKK